MSSANTKLVKMVHIEEVVHIRWTPEKGATLRRLRGEMSRRALEEKMAEIGYSCTHENLRRLENGLTTYVPIDLVEGICQALAVDLQVFIKMFHVVAELLQEDTTDYGHLDATEDGPNIEEK